MPCPKNVVNCPDRDYRRMNNTKVSKPVKLESNTTIIGNKKFTIKPKAR